MGLVSSTQRLPCKQIDNRDYRLGHPGVLARLARHGRLQIHSANQWHDLDACQLRLPQVRTTATLRWKLKDEDCRDCTQQQPCQTQITWLKATGSSRLIDLLQTTRDRLLPHSPQFSKVVDVRDCRGFRLAIMETWREMLLSTFLRRHTLNAWGWTQVFFQVFYAILVMQQEGVVHGKMGLNDDSIYIQKWDQRVNRVYLLGPEPSQWFVISIEYQVEIKWTPEVPRPQQSDSATILRSLLDAGQIDQGILDRLGGPTATAERVLQSDFWDLSRFDNVVVQLGRWQQLFGPQSVWEAYSPTGELTQAQMAQLTNAAKRRLLPASREELPYGGSMNEAAKQRDQFAAQLIMLFNIQQMQTDTDEPEPEPEPSGLPTFDHTDCTNDRDYVTRREWSDSYRPEVKIYFMTGGSRPNTQCYMEAGLQRIIADNEFRLWVPKADRQRTGEPMDSQGRGGMPSAAEAVTLLPDGALILTPQQPVTAGEYTGIQLYMGCYGNLYASFLQLGDRHGQDKVWFYLVAPQGQELMMLKSELVRQVGMRDPDANFDFYQPADNTVEDIVMAIRRVVQDYPIPLADVGREKVYVVSDEEYDRWQAEMEGVSAETAQQLQAEELQVEPQPEPMDREELVNKVVALLRDGWGIVVDTQTKQLVSMAPADRMAQELQVQNLSAAEIDRTLSHSSERHYYFDPAAYHEPLADPPRHLDDRDIVLLLEVADNDLSLQNELDNEGAEVRTALTRDEIRMVASYLLYHDNIAYVFEWQVVAMRYLMKVDLNVDRWEDVLLDHWDELTDDDMDRIANGEHDELVVVQWHDNFPLPRELELLHSNQVPEYFMEDLFYAYFLHDYPLEQFKEYLDNEVLFYVPGEGVLTQQQLTINGRLPLDEALRQLDPDGLAIRPSHHEEPGEELSLNDLRHRFFRSEAFRTDLYDWFLHRFVMEPHAFQDNLGRVVQRYGFRFTRPVPKRPKKEELFIDLT